MLAIALASILAACAADRPTFDAHRDGASRPRDGASDDFFRDLDQCGDVLAHSPWAQALGARIRDAVRVDLEPPYDETARLVIRLGPAGYVDWIALRSVSDPALEAPFELMIAAPPALPRAPVDVRHCLGTVPFPFMVKMIEHFVCDSRDDVIRYHEDFGQSVIDALSLPEFAGRGGEGWVRLRVGVTEDGSVRSIQVQGEPDPIARDTVIAAVRHVEPLPRPPEFGRCFEARAVPLVIRLFAP